MIGRAPLLDLDTMTTTTTFLGIEATRVDPLSAEFETWVEVLDQCMVEEWGRLAPTTSIPALRSLAANAAYAPRYFMVRVRGRIAGVGLVEAPFSAPGSNSFSSFGIVRVLKAVQGYGIGRTLIAAVEDEARALGATAVATISSARSYRDDRTTRIIRRAGYKEVNTKLRMDLDLDEMATPVADAFLPAQGFQIKTFIGSVPDDVVQNLTELTQRVLSPEQLDDAVFNDAEQGRAAIEAAQQADRIPLVTMAEDQRTGLPVAYATASAALDVRRSEEGPTVLSDVARRHPSVVTAMLARLVDTSHAALQGSGHMRHFAGWQDPDLIGHHRAIGYRDTGFYRDWTKDLAPERS